MDARRALLARKLHLHPLPRRRLTVSGRLRCTKLSGLSMIKSLASHLGTLSGTVEYEAFSTSHENRDAYAPHARRAQNFLSACPGLDQGCRRTCQTKPSSVSDSALNQALPAQSSPVCCSGTSTPRVRRDATVHAQQAGCL